MRNTAVPAFLTFLQDVPAIESTQFNAIQRESTQFNANQRNSTRINAIQRESTQFNENPRNSTKIKAIPHELTQHNEKLRKSTRIHVLLFRCRTIIRAETYRLWFLVRRLKSTRNDSTFRPNEIREIEQRASPAGRSGHIPWTQNKKRWFPLPHRSNWFVPRGRYSTLEQWSVESPKSAP